MLNLQVKERYSIKIGNQCGRSFGEFFSTRWCYFCNEIWCTLSTYQMSRGLGRNTYERYLETTLHDCLIAVTTTARAIKSICNYKFCGFNFRHSLLGVWRVRLQYALALANIIALHSPKHCLLILFCLIHIRSKRSG